MTDPLTDVQVGPLTYRMTRAQFDALGDVPDKIASIYGQRLDAVLVVTRPYEDMPLIRPGLRARAKWSERFRRILLSVPFTYGVQAVLGHEATHVLDDDWLTRAQRRAIIPYISPIPAGWGDLTIGDNPPVYEASPAECFASYGAAAMLGVRPAFPTLYLRKIDQAHYSNVRAIALSAPDAPDPCAELQEELDQVLVELGISQARVAELEKVSLDSSSALEVIAAQLRDAASPATPAEG